MKTERTDISIIGNNIAKYRKKKGYTQKQLGELLDVNYKTISKWENGNVGPDITILPNLADVLGVSIEEILLGVKKKNKKRSTRIIISIMISCVFMAVLTMSIITCLNSYKVYEFESDNEEFNFNGFILSSAKENRYIFYDIDCFKNIDEDILIDYINLDFFVNGKVISNYETSYDKEKSLLDALNEVEFNGYTTSMISSDFENIEKDDFYLKISYSLNGGDRKDKTVYLNYK